MLVMDKVREMLDDQKQGKEERIQKELELQQEIERIKTRRARTKREYEQEQELEQERGTVEEPEQEQKYDIISINDVYDNRELRTLKNRDISINDWVDALGSRKVSDELRLTTPQLEELNVKLGLKVYKYKNGTVKRKDTSRELVYYLDDERKSRKLRKLIENGVVNKHISISDLFKPSKKKLK